MLIALIVLTSVVSIAALRDRALFDRLLFSPFEIEVKKERYRFITHAFVHGSVGHLLVNMFVLLMFGSRVLAGYAELGDGSAMLPFALLYLGGIVLSALPGYRKHRFDPTYRAVGASGATSAVVFASILMYPTDKLSLILLPIPTPAWLFGILYLGYEYYASQKDRDGIAHDAHFYGALFGVLFTGALWPRLLPAFVHTITGH